MHLKPDDLMTLERYARERKAFRDRVIAHKKLRNVAVGPHLTWLFEDRLTIQYQVQEILRTERIFEPEGIVDELEAYNPLIPDGTNFKVTLLIEFPDPVIRAAELKRLKGIEDRCYVRVAGFAPVYAIADEDLERENEEKTSSVHFLRFEIPAEARAAVRDGAALAFGTDHPVYTHEVTVGEERRAALAVDLAA
ncbi:MAG: DUF3501 family protein [Gammaproteobacteria bacterium]